MHLADIESYRVVEITSSNCLLYWCDIVRVGITLNEDLDTLTESRQLIPDITGTTETLELQELFVAELLRVVRFRPLLPYVEESEVVAACADKVLPRLIGVQLLVLRPVEQ